VSPQPALEATTLLTRPVKGLWVTSARAGSRTEGPRQGGVLFWPCTAVQVPVTVLTMTPAHSLTLEVRELATAIDAH
jgi:hypothetical protein